MSAGTVPLERFEVEGRDALLPRLYWRPRIQAVGLIVIETEIVSRSIPARAPDVLVVSDGHGLASPPPATGIVRVVAIASAIIEIADKPRPVPAVST